MFRKLGEAYLTIRLRARDFYEVIIVLVESKIKHNILHKNIKKRELKVIFNAPGNCFSRIRDQT